MGLGLGGVRLNLELYVRGLYKEYEAILDLGAQDLLLKKAELLQAFAAAGISAPTRDFARLDEMPAKRMGAEAFYRALGFKRYVCMDIGGGLSGIEPHLRPVLAKGGMRWNALKQDLNHPLAYPELAGCFDVVTDYGNNEHVFDLTQAYRTQHILCKTGGMIIVQQQVFDGNGYYCFNPSYYETMAAANEYEVLFAAYEFNQNFVPIESDIGQLLHRKAPLGVAYVMRKTSDRTFRIPGQADLDRKPDRTARIQLQRLPDDHPFTFVPLMGGNETQTVGGRDALTALITKAKSVFKHG